MSIVGDPYEFHLPAPNAGVTIPGVVTTVDGSGNVLSAMPLDADTGGGGAAGTEYHYEESVGTQIVTASRDLSASSVDRLDPTAYGDLGAPVEFVVDVPSGASAFVFTSSELAFYDTPNAIANGDATDSWAQSFNAIIAPPVAPFIQTGGTIVSSSTPEQRVAGVWVRAYGGDAGSSQEIAVVDSPEGTVPPNVAPFSQWANLAAGQYNIALKNFVVVGERDGSGAIVVEQSPKRIQIRKRKLTAVLLAP
jgi:hypothetical protein